MFTDHDCSAGFPFAKHCDILTNVKRQPTYTIAIITHTESNPFYRKKPLQVEANNFPKFVQRVPWHLSINSILLWIKFSRWNVF